MCENAKDNKVGQRIRGRRNIGARIILDKKAVARNGRGKPVLISRQGEYGNVCQVGRGLQVN